MTTPPKKRNRANIKTKEAEKRKLNSVIINTKVSDVVIINVVIIKTKGYMSRTPRTRICTFFCHPRFFFVSPYLHFTTYSHPEWPSLLQPTTRVSQRNKLKKIWATYDTQTLLYCLFTPNYSSITPVCVGWVPDVHTHLFVIELSPPNDSHVVTWPPDTVPVKPVRTSFFFPCVVFRHRLFSNFFLPPLSPNLLTEHF